MKYGVVIKFAMKPDNNILISVLVTREYLWGEWIWHKHSWRLAVLQPSFWNNGYIDQKLFNNQMETMSIVKFWSVINYVSLEDKMNSFKYSLFTKASYGYVEPKGNEYKFTYCVSFLQLYSLLRNSQVMSF